MGSCWLLFPPGWWQLYQLLMSQECKNKKKNNKNKLNKISIESEGNIINGAFNTVLLRLSFNKWPIQCFQVIVHQIKSFRFNKFYANKLHFHNNSTTFKINKWFSWSDWQNNEIQKHFNVWTCLILNVTMIGNIVFEASKVKIYFAIPGNSPNLLWLV